jgi:hypothetical protein
MDEVSIGSGPDEDANADGEEEATTIDLGTPENRSLCRPMPPSRPYWTATGSGGLRT